MASTFFRKLGRVMLIVFMFFLIAFPMSYIKNHEQPWEFLSYSWVLLITTVLFIGASFTVDNLFTKIFLPKLSKTNNVVMGLLYIVVLLGFVYGAITTESYRDNMFLGLSIGVSLFCAVLSAIYGGTIRTISVKLGILIFAFLFAILVWIAESFSSYYGGVEIGALQASALYQNTIKKIVLEDPDEKSQKEKIIKFSKNVNKKTSISAKITKNNELFLEPVNKGRTGYILSKEVADEFSDSYGNKYTVSYRFYNRPELIAGINADYWGGLTKAIIFSAHEANEEFIDNGKPAIKDNKYYFGRENYLRSLNMWWIFWLIYGLFMYGYFHYQQKGQALKEREEALAEKDKAYQKQKEAYAELDKMAKAKDEAYKKQKEAYAELDKMAKAKDEAYQKQKEAYAQLTKMTEAKDEALLNLENFRLTYDKIRNDFATRTSNSKNYLQIVNSTYDKQAWDVQEKAAAKLGRHDVFGAFNKFREWKKEQFLDKLATGVIDTKNYEENVKQYFALLDAIGQEYDENLIADTYDITLGPWIKVMQNDLKELEHVLDITPETKVVKEVLDAIVPGKAIPRNLAENKLEAKQFKMDVSVSDNARNNGKCTKLVLSKLQSIIFNLIENSARAIDVHFDKLPFEEKFGYDGLIELRITDTVHTFKKNNKTCKALCFEIQDNAGGFPEDYLKDIYKRPVLSDKKADRKYGEGTVYIGFFVDLMDGDIEAHNVESENTGRGALTKVFIPYYEREV
jgi:hypothetical protein